MIAHSLPTVFLAIYLFGVTTIALWLGYVMRTKLDKYDWQFERFDIWMNFLLSCIFWPLLFIKPKSLLNPETMLRQDDFFGINITQRFRELGQLAENPPPCGRVIHYEHNNELNSVAEVTSVYFYTEDMLKFWGGKDLPLIPPEAGVFVAWVSQRDMSIKEPTDVPSQIGFSKMAFAMIKKGLGTIECEECGKHFKAAELTVETPPTHAGWNYEYHICPSGHKILSHRNTHISVRA